MDGWAYGFIAKFTLRALTKFISRKRTKNRAMAQRHWQKQITRTHKYVLWEDIGIQLDSSN